MDFVRRHFLLRTETHARGAGDGFAGAQAPSALNHKRTEEQSDEEEEEQSDVEQNGNHVHVRCAQGTERDARGMARVGAQRNSASEETTPRAACRVPLPFYASAFEESIHSTASALSRVPPTLSPPLTPPAPFAKGKARM